MFAPHLDVLRLREQVGGGVDRSVRLGRRRRRGVAGGRRGAGRTGHPDRGAVVRRVGRALDALAHVEWQRERAVAVAPPEGVRVVEVVQRDRVEQPAHRQLAGRVVAGVARIAVADVRGTGVEPVALGVLGPFEQRRRRRGADRDTARSGLRRRRRCRTGSRRRQDPAWAHPAGPAWWAASGPAARLAEASSSAASVTTIRLRIACLQLPQEELAVRVIRPMNLLVAVRAGLAVHLVGVS